MNNDDLAKLIIKVLEEYLAFYPAITTGGSAGSTITVNLDGKAVKATALTNCRPGSVSVIKSKDNKYYAINESLNTLLNTTYTRYRQKRNKPKVYTDKATITNYNVPILFSKDDIKVPVLYKKTSTEYGDAAILFHTVQSYPGPHPDELCPCSYWMPTSNACVKTCAGTGEFKTQGDCDNYRDNRKDGYAKYYHTTGNAGISRNDGLPYYGSKLNTSGLYHPPYDLAAEGDMFMVKFGGQTGVDMDGYDYATQRFYRGVSSNKIFYEWYELTFIYVGLQKLYVNNSTGQAYKTITQYEEWFDRYPEPFPQYIKPDKPYTVTGKVWQRNWEYRSWPVRLSPDDPPRPTNPPPNNTNYIVPSWSNYMPWGEVQGWYEEVVSIKPPPIPPAPYAPVEDPDTKRYMTIKYYVGGHTENPIYLGEYLSYYTPSYDPNSPSSVNNNPIDCYEGDLALSNIETLGELSNAYIVAIGEHEYEVVIKYGGFAKSNDFYAPNGTSGSRITSYYYCKIDTFYIYKDTVVKKTYNYPTPPQLSDKNWMKLFLSNWIKYDVNSSKEYPYYKTNSKSENEANLDAYISFKATDNFTLNFSVALGLTNKEHCIYLSRLLAYYKKNVLKLRRYSTQFTTSSIPVKVKGSEASLINLKNNVVSVLNLNFVIDSNNPDKSYGVDCDGNQWVGEGCFIDEVKTKTLTNVPIKTGVVKANWYSYAEDYVSSPEFSAVVGNSWTNTLAFESGGTSYLSKVYSLKTPVCNIKQITSWKNPSDIDDVTKPFYSHLVKGVVSFSYGDEYEYSPLTVYTYNSSSINHQLPSHTYNGFRGFFYKDGVQLGQPEYNDYGWYYIGYPFFKKNDGLYGQIVFPIQLKDCAGNVVVTIPWDNNSNGLTTSGNRFGTPTTGLTNTEIVTINCKNCIVVGICGG